MNYNSACQCVSNASSLDDLDLYVITPGGATIYYDNRFDSESGGQLDQDDIPSSEELLWVENIYFPMDGGLVGRYTYYVDNFRQQDDADESWTLRVYVGDELVAIQSGEFLAHKEQSERFTFEVQP